MVQGKFLSGFIALFSFLVFLSLPAFPAGFSGIVYADLNRNGHKDSNESGIKGVAVSDGLNVVLTGTDGQYELPGTKKTRFLAVTVPRGYRTVNKHYIRTGEPATGYDFGLAPFPRSRNNKVRFIQITDTEATGDYGWIGPIRDYAANEGVCFIVHTGDICYERGLNFHGKNVTSETMGVPVFYCIGNHDLVKGNYGEELFENNFGPAYYSFEAGNTHFIVTPMLAGDYAPSYTREDVYRWMKNDLQQVDPSKNLVIFNHNLLTFDDKFNYGINDKEQINLNEHNLKAWIYGHWHSNFMKHHGNTGIVSVCASPPDKGGIDHSPDNFLVFEMNENGELSVHPRYNYLNNHFTAISPNGNQCALDENNQLLITVNTYSTSSPTEKTEYRIEGIDGWRPLTQQTDWNWSGRYPAAKLKAGNAYKILFRTKLKNGDIFTTTRNFVIPDAHDSEIRRVNQTGISADQNPPKDPDDNQIAGLQLKWTTNAGSNMGMCSPIYADGRLFVASMDEFGQRNYILAYDGITGKLVWKYKTGSPVKNSICLEGNHLLAADEEGTAYAINSRTGELAWKRELGMNNLPMLVTGSVAHNGIFYCGFGNYLSALDSRDGSVIWKNTSWNGGEGTTSTLSICGNTLIAGSNWRALYGHDRQTGTKKWEISQEGTRFCNGTPAWVDDTLFVTAEKAIIKMDPATGSVYSVHPVPYDLQVATSPLLNEKILVTGTSAEGLVAYDRYSFKEAWKVKTGASLIYTAPYSKPYSATVESAPVPIENRIVFGASDGFLYVVDQDNGRIVTKINLGAPVLGKICVTGNVLYVADFSGNISCFSVMKE